MADKFFGLSVGSLQSLVDEYGCVIRRRDLVEVVTVEWLEKYCKEHGDFVDMYEIKKTIEVDVLLDAVRLRVVEKEE